MSTTDTRVTINVYEDILDAWLTEVSERSAHKAADEIRDRARRKAPHRTGAGAASIDSRLVSTGPKGTVFKIGPSLGYMVIQERGTGPIFARPGGVMAFRSGGVMVFARRTRGVPAVHFMRDAFLETTIEDFNTGA